MSKKKYSVVLLFLFFSISIIAQKESFTLEDIFLTGKFRTATAAPLNILNNGTDMWEFASENGSWRIDRIDVKTGEKKGVIFNSTSIAENITPSNLEFSANEKFLLVETNSESIYRHSTKAIVYAINLSSNEVIKLDNEKIMYATISPANNFAAFVKDNNLYIKNLISKETISITKDGEKNKIINGAVDWVYEEEFSMSRGYEWNKNGDAIAYYKFNESNVKEFSMDVFSQLYPTAEKWKYPKAGEDNSTVDVYIFDLNNKNNLQLQTNSHADQYLPRIKWTAENDILSVQRMNRKQNNWEIIFYKKNNPIGEVIYSESSKTYIDITDNLFFLANKKQFIFTSEKNGFNHLYNYDYELKKITQLTTGNWDVLEYYGMDEKTGDFYYSSSAVSATELHFYRAGNKEKRFLHYTNYTGNNTIQMGKGLKYFVVINSAINSPSTYTLYNINGKKIRDLEKNNSAKKVFEKTNFGEVKFGTLKTESGIELNYWMILPPNFDASKKYPMFMHCYGGPGVNTVLNKYGGRNFLWHQYLAQQGYIVVSVDNRGTGRRGTDFKNATYLQLGKLEQIDQREAAKYFSTLNYVDAKRIGIWGWSFGGYLTSLCLAKSSDVFKMGIAVAPVTNWRYYDNIYTERYLQKPQENEKGYDNNSPINFVKGIKAKYLIIHGTADDNVHFQNSVEMINAMIKEGVEYDSEIYPNRNHGIGDRNAQYHLYKRMTKFVMENL